jgi:Fe-S cluster assembly protein SufB
MSDEKTVVATIGSDYTEKYGFRDPENYVFKSDKGLTREVVEQISLMKGEPDWMRERRLEAYEHNLRRPTPTWGGDLSGLDLDDIYYYVRPAEQEAGDWDDVPDDIKNTFDRLGIPEAEQKFLAGVGAQYESEMVYHKVQKHLEEQGVIFLSSDDGLKKYPEIYEQYFGTVKSIPKSMSNTLALSCPSRTTSSRPSTLLVGRGALLSTYHPVSTLRCRCRPISD